MKKRHMVVIVALIVLVSLLVFKFGCGKMTTSSSSITGESISVKGKASAASSSSLTKFIRSRVAVSGTVVVGLPTVNSDDLTYIATGIADSTGAFDITVPIARLTLTENVMVVVLDSNGNEVAGSTIPTMDLTSPDAYSMPSDSELIKQKFARAGFGKGINPAGFDFSGKVDRKFNDLSGYSISDTDKFDKMGEALLSNDSVRDEIAAGLGITTAQLALMDAKGQEYHKTYIEPIMRTAFDAGTPPDRAAMDLAFSQMEQAMKVYALSIGLTEQQFFDLKSMQDQQMAGEVKRQLGSADNAVKEMDRRNMGSKMVDLFYTQYDAGVVLAQATSTGKQSFAATDAARYAEYVAAKEIIANALRAKINDASITNPMEISEYLRLNFFDAWLLPPANSMPGEGKEMTPQQMEATMQQYISGSSARILVAFMNHFDQSARGQIFGAMGNTMQPIFQNRFQNQSSPYYMGPIYWASNPTAADIQTRMGLFKAALDAAVESICRTKFEAVFGVSASTNRLIDAFKILNAPSDMM